MDAEKPIGRKPLDHEPPWWLPSTADDYFITICCQQRGANQLCLPTVGKALLNSARYYHTQRKWFPNIFLLMPDHLHMIVSFGEANNIAKTIGEWKRFTSLQYKIVWQKNFFDHRLRGNESWEEKSRYILQNPVRAGLVTDVAAWPYVFMLDEVSGRARII